MKNVYRKEVAGGRQEHAKKSMASLNSVERHGRDLRKAAIKESSRDGAGRYEAASSLQ